MEEERKGLRVVVCGGRSFGNRAWLYHVLRGVHRDRAIIALAHGGAAGADTLTGDWARENDVPCEVFPADWKRFGTAAGPIRNGTMLRNFKPDLVVSFPGARGTLNCIQQAMELGIPVEDHRG